MGDAMKRTEAITWRFTPYTKAEYDKLPEVAKKELHIEIERIVGKKCHAELHYDSLLYIGGIEE